MGPCIQTSAGLNQPPAPDPKHQLFHSTGLLWCYFTTGLWKSARDTMTTTTPGLPFVHFFVLKVETSLSTKQQPCSTARSQMALMCLAGPRWSSYQESICSHSVVLWVLLIRKFKLSVSLSVSLKLLTHHFTLFGLSQKLSFVEIRCLGNWLCRFLYSQG